MVFIVQSVYTGFDGESCDPVVTVHLTRADAVAAIERTVAHFARDGGVVVRDEDSDTWVAVAGRNEVNTVTLREEKATYTQRGLWRRQYV